MNPAPSAAAAALAADPLPATSEQRLARMSRRRALVLLGVHLLVGLHVAHYLIAGRTLAPLELNEVMHTIELGIVTAGFLLMATAAISVAIFGRFFCGWACHVLALQDGCAWLLRKVGFKPRPFRSRLLLWIPFIVAFYMMIWPSISRWIAGRPHPGLRFATDREGWASFITENFTRNLPGPGIAILTFAIAGIAGVILLGTRSFCANGCPYGAAFNLLDRIAPGRIRAVKTCEGCGTCTAVCSSHVRVHEEIARYGTVVDPRCLRDLDCVAVCPNEGLAFGFGKPALFTPKISDTKVRHFADFSWGEELAMAVVFTGTLFTLRGLYDLVPFLMSIAAGIAAAAWSIFAWRFVRRPELTLAGFRLRSQGRVRSAGWIFAVLYLALVAFLGHSLLLRVLDARASRAFEGVRAASYSDGAAVRQADDQLKFVDRLGLMRVARIEESMYELHLGRAKVAAAERRPVEAAQHLADAAGLRPLDGHLRCELGASLIESGQPDAALRQLDVAIRLDPGFADSHHNRAIALDALGRRPAALAEATEAARLSPDDATIRSFLDHLRSSPPGR